MTTEGRRLKLVGSVGVVATGSEICPADTVLAAVHVHCLAVLESTRLVAVGVNARPVRTGSCETAHAGDRRMGLARFGGGIAGDADGQMGLARLVPVPANAGFVRLFVRQPSSFTLCAGLCGLECDAPVRGIARQALCAGGFYRLAALLPLALTSTHRARKALGRSWRQLHRLIYPAAVLAWLHLFWLARSDWGEALLYGAVLGGLLAWRVRRQYINQSCPCGGLNGLLIFVSALRLVARNGPPN